jgi:hypothetical protein
MTRHLALATTLLLGTLSGGALAGDDDLKLPPQITPAVRAACEADVRRLCVRDDSTADSVKECVMQKFLSLGRRCRTEIASAGLMR